MKKLKVLVANKPAQLTKLLTIGLGSFGYEVVTPGNREEIPAAVARYMPDLLLLHTLVPLETMPLIRELRQWSNIPIIILSPLDVQQIKVLAFESGADDYVIEPFSVPELEARIRAILRRTTDQQAEQTQSLIQVNNLEIDLAKRRVTFCNVDLHLTPTEYDVLRLLVVHAGKILTHSMIASEIWGPNTTNGAHYVRVFVNTIRKKLREDRRNPYIRSHLGIGYEFVALDIALDSVVARRK